MAIQAHAAEIRTGDDIAYEDDKGQRRRIKALRILRDVGCVHVWTWDRVVTFPAMYPVEVAR